MYLIAKNDTTQVHRLAELIKRFLVKLSARANIEISYLKNSISKEAQFKSIIEKIENDNIVEYIHLIFNKVVEQEESEEISELLQFAFNWFILFLHTIYLKQKSRVFGYSSCQ